MVEILVIAGIMIVLGGVVMSNYFGYQTRQSLDGAADELLGNLRDAQQRAISQDQQSAWGVYINALSEGNDYYEVFYGDSRGSGTLFSKVTLPVDIEFFIPAQGNALEINFAKSTGLPSIGTITLISKRNASLSKIISFNTTSGLISMVSGLSAAIIFITSSGHTGNLGGLAGADARCQTLAAAAGLSGTYKSWLSDGFTAAKDRLVHSSAPYKLVDGTIIANNWTDLTDGALLAPINKSESGSLLLDRPVFASTASDGSQAGGAYCADWTTEQPAEPPCSIGAFGYGDNTRIDSWWTHVPAGGCICGQNWSLYCIQQN